jgi:hypothetical protein
MLIRIDSLFTFNLSQLFHLLLFMGGRLLLEFEVIMHLSGGCKDEWTVFQ